MWYQVKAFNGVAEQYFGDSLKEAEEVFFKSKSATHLFKVEGENKTLIRTFEKRNKYPDQMLQAFAQA